MSAGLFWSRCLSALINARRETPDGKQEEERGKLLESNLLKKTGKVEIFAQRHERSPVSAVKAAERGEQTACAAECGNSQTFSLSILRVIYSSADVPAACYAE